jgi:ABC-type nitrate/sulfonate/bicarbonate transport system substrate-binding protein
MVADSPTASVGPLGPGEPNQEAPLASPTPPMDRRELLRLAARWGAGSAAFGLGLPALLAACSSDDAKDNTTTTTGKAAQTESTSAAKKDLGTLDFRLSWIKNVEFAGEYIADSMGFYAAEGFSSVNLISGGPTATPIETDVATKKALVGISAPDITGTAIKKSGAKLRIIGAQYQKNPFAIMSLKSKPINTPQDMIGKKIGVQATNEAIWTAFLKAAKIDPSKVTKIPVQFDPLPLTQGQADGWFSFFTNEPNDLRHKGFEVTQFLLADFGYPLVSEVFVVREESLTTERDKLKGLLRADIKGWTESLRDPTKGPNLTTSKYGKDLGLNTDEQILESKSENSVILTEETKKNGLFTITDKLLDENIATLELAGVSIGKDELFDMSVLAEVYKEDPSLISALADIPIPVAPS